MLPKPKLPKKLKAKPRFFTIAEASKIVANAEGEHRVFYWLAAETGMRAGELAGLRLTDIDGESLTVNQSVWLGQEQTTKTINSDGRKIALSPQLVALLWEQIARQKAKAEGVGHEFLFSASTGSPWDMNVFRKRKMKKLLASLKISQAGFHAFRHFNVGLMDALRVPLKVIQQRIGHAYTGSFTLDVYGGTPEFKGNADAANALGAAIGEAVQKAEHAANVVPFVSLTAIQENGSQSLELEAV